MTTADLSRLGGGVAMDVPGHDIGAPGWVDMSLENGRIGAGTAGNGHPRLEALKHENREPRRAVELLPTTVVPCGPRDAVGAISATDRAFDVITRRAISLRRTNRPSRRA